VLRASALIRAGESGEAAGLLREAAAVLESKGSLTLRSIAFAERILSFGVWDETKAVFKPGDRAMLYCELLGFACVKRAAEEYGVSLNFALSVEREDGSVVVRSLRDDPVEHKTKSRIHDLHLCSRFDLPKGLLPGKYIIRATVTDRSTGASASAGIPFEISEAAAPENK
jgi:hypothetical protein